MCKWFTVVRLVIQRCAMHRFTYRLLIPPESCECLRTHT
jgi:hypothetical protein